MATATEPRIGAPGFADSGLPPLTDKDLDPLLLQLGTLVGLLTDQGDGTYQIDATWFEQPWQRIEQIPSQRAGELLALLETLVGTAAPGAIGQPHTADGLLWYPLLIPGVATGGDSPLYLVAPARDTAGPVVLGVGARYAITVEGVAFTAYAHLPLLQIGGGESARLVLGTGLPATPAQVGIEVGGIDLAAGDVKCGGLQFRCSVELTGGAPELDLVFLALQLPGQAAPSDQTLADVKALGAGEWIATALSVLANQLGTLVPDYKTTIDQFVASALGLLGITSTAPAPDWEKLFEDPADALLDWAGAIAATSPTLKQWLTLLAGVLDASAPPPPDAVTGTGTRADPFAVPVASLGGVQVAMTVGTEVDTDGARHVYPGAAVAAQPPSPSGLPAVAVDLAVAAELADLVVPTPAGRREGTLAPHLPLTSLGVRATLRNPNAKLPLVSVADPDPNVPTGTTFSIGSGVAGLRYDGAAETLVPQFELIGVTSGVGSWPVVDFSSAQAMINAAGQVLTGIVQTALDSFFGLGKGNGPSGPAAGLAALLGLTAPADYEDTWPVPLLLDGDGIEAVVADPLGALGEYYARVLAAPAPSKGPAPVAALLGSVAILMGQQAPAPEGSGTLIDPWSATIVDAGNGLTARLVAWSPASGELRVGIAAAFALELGDAVVAPELEVSLVDVQLPAGGAPSGGWLPGVSATVLTSGSSGALTVPPVGGISLSLTRAGLSAGWSRQSGSWYAVVEIDGAELIAGRVIVPLDLPVFDVVPSGWTPAQFTQLASAALHLIGLWLLEHGGRAGVALTTVLGLLPDLPDVFAAKDPPFPLPPDFTLPTPWPTLTVGDPGTFFTAPWQDVRTQIAALLATPATGQAAATLVGWALTGTATTPAVTPAGTSDDPFVAALGGPRAAALLAWKTAPAAGCGLGVELQTASEELSAVTVTTLVRLDACAFRLGSAPVDFTPDLRLVAAFANPKAGTPLIDDTTTGLQIGAAEIGATFSAGGVSPLATFLDATPGGGVEAGTVDVAMALGSSLELQRLGTLVGALFGLLSRQAPGSSNGGGASPLDAVFDVLDALDVTAPAQGGGTGVDTASWTALLADPQQYASRCLRVLLADADATQRVLDDVAVLLGLKPIRPEEGVQCVMAVAAALGLGAPSAVGPLPSLPAIVALLRDPVGAVAKLATALFADPDAVKQLVTTLTGFAGSGPLPLPVPGVTVTVDKGTAVTVATSGTALGAELTLAGALTLDVTRSSIAGQASVGSRTAGVAVVLDGEVQAGAQSTWELAIGVPQQPTPAPFDPVRLIGSAGGIDPDVIAVAVPTLAISNVATALLNGFVLPASPLASRLAVALGLAPPPPTGQPARVASLAGAFMHPASWLDGVLGDGTSVELHKLGPALAALAAGGVDGPGGITLTPVADTGVAVAGLPYGAGMTLNATADGLTLSATFGETVAGVAVTVAPAVTYAPPAGVTVGGDATLKCTLDGQPFVIAADYTAGAFGLTVTAEGSDFVLVPFGGFNQYLKAGTTAVLQFVADEALAAYKAAKPPQAVTALVDALGDVASAAGISSVASLMQAAEAIVEDPLAWLGGLEGDADKLAQAIAALLSQTLDIQGISASGGAVAYQPTLGAMAAAKASFGFDGAGHLGVWLQPSVTVAPLEFSATAGAAVDVPIGKSPAFDLTAQGALAVTGVPGLPGPPTLRGAVDWTGGEPTFSVKVFPCGPPSSEALPGPEQPAIELLPTFALTTLTGTAIPVTEWLEDAAFAVAIPVLGSAALNVDVVKAWLTKNVIGNTSVAAIAAKLGVLESATKLVPTDLRTVFSGMTAEQAVAKVAGTALDALAGLDLLPAALAPATITLTSTGGGNSPTTYGLLATLPDIVISGADGRSTKVVLQLGAWPTGDTKPYWVSRSLSSAPDADKPGIAVELVSSDGNTMTFAPALALVSVGVDVTGAANAPLFEVAGCSLGGVEARVYAAVGGSSWYAGAAVRLDDLALPLGPKLGSNGNANPVAENLLSSGGSDGAPPVNPALSAMVGVVEPGGTPDVQFVGDQPGDTPTHLVIPIQRGLGPLYCQQIELDWTATGPRLGVGFDGSVSLAGLAIAVQGLEVTIPVKHPLERSGYGLELAGLEVAFEGGPVTIDGGLLETTDKDGNKEYTGGLIVQAEQFGLTVLGSYTVVKVGDSEQPSLFAFGLLDAPIGGPPFFFVTGIAAGFGYNRGLILPGQDEVTSFPLVAGVIDPKKYFPDWKSDPGTALTALDKWIPPTAGEYWLAAGVQFTTFELLKSTALLAIEFGTELAVALFGVSTLEVPSEGGQEIPAIARATLALEAVFKPSAGTLSVAAVLTPDSYVLDPAAHLTGGFAFDLWWAGENAGQFVLTVGGYSPRFEPPAYYPQEQRLGLSWSMGPVQLVGGAYFALTPSAVMAGGELSLTYDGGNLKAWLDASADVLIRWKPFGFDIDISISIGASYRVNVWFIHKTFTIELGASLELHGMPVGGKVSVHWYVISFTVHFGKDNVTATPLPWADFETSFLSAKQDGDPQQVVRGAVTSGLDKTLDDTNTAWLVGPRFTLGTSSLVPSTQATFNGAAPAGSWTTQLGVRPMQVTALASSHEVTLTDHTGKDASGQLAVTAVTSNVPAALWSPDPQQQATPSNDLVPDGLTGLTITAATDPSVSLTPIQLSYLTSESKRNAPWAQPTRPTGPSYSREHVPEQIEAALTSGSEQREGMIAALQPTFPELPTDVPSVLAHFADQALQAAPVLVALGADPTAETGSEA